MVDGEANRDAAWYYPNPSAAALPIAGHLAFWRGVRIERSGTANVPEAAQHRDDGHDEAGEHSGRRGFLRRLLSTTPR